MNERAAAIIANARKTLERAKAEREDVEADIERRQLEDRTIPTLPVRRDELVLKQTELKKFFEWYDDSKLTTQATPVTGTSTPTQDWQTWIENHVQGRFDELFDVTAQALGMTEFDVKRELGREIEELRAEVKSLRAELAQQKELAVPGPFLQLRARNDAA